MDDLITFLRARLDDDERTARRATEGPWEIRFLGRHDLSTVVRGKELLAQLDGNRAANNSVHMAVHDPARVLAEVDAKRRIIQAEQDRSLDDGLPERLIDRYESDVLRLLVLPYASHPDYRDEWRP